MGNIGLIGSFIIGGIILLMLLSLSAYLTNKSHSTVMNEISQYSVTEFGNVIEYDFKKMGYRVGVGNGILNTDSSSISFLADLDNDGTVDSVSYYTEQNDNGIKIVRETSLDQAAPFRMIASDLTILGYDSTGSVTTNLALIKSFQVTILIDEALQFKDETEQFGAYWRRRFVPKNIQ